MTEARVELSRAMRRLNDDLDHAAYSGDDRLMAEALVLRMARTYQRLSVHEEGSDDGDDDLRRILDREVGE